MKHYEKKNAINSLNSIENLTRIVEEILVKADIKNIRRKEGGIITVEEKNLLSQKNSLYILSFEELTGKRSDVHERLEKIRYSDFNTICVVTGNMKKISDYYKEKVKEAFPKVSFEFWDLNHLTKLIDKIYPDFWSHDDVFIRPYEDYYCKSVKEDFELRSLKLDKKYKKMLDIFIEPRLSVLIEDKENDKAFFRKSIDQNKIFKSGNFIITGEPGTGKTTLLKEIGLQAINENKGSQNKTIPIFIKYLDVFNSDFDLNKAIDKVLLKVFKKFDLRKVFKNYKILLLIDSIEEFDEKIQGQIIKALEKLAQDFDVRFVISSRNLDYFFEDFQFNLDYEIIIMESFNIRQSKKFIEHFFRYDTDKSNKLLDSLRENRILEKLSMTPLTLSLISILFEEKQFEIPATITDIYDNFKHILLGRTNVKTSLDFLDINIKERILSLYGLEILKDSTKQPKTVDEFKEFISSFLKSKNSLIRESILPEVLEYFTKEIGVLYIEDRNFVNFKHSSFMEYFAALEIFNQQQDLEGELVEKFTDLNWQNTSIFYAGRSKDMPSFLKKVIQKLKTYNKAVDYMVSSFGMGYLLQALYLTDEKTRKRAILEALDINTKLYDELKILASEKSNFFSGLKLPSVAILNSTFFYYNFNSITLKSPLIEVFNDLKKDYDQLLQNDDPRVKTIGYKLFNIAITLNSDRINDKSKVEELFDTKGILEDPFLVMLFDIVLEIVNPDSAQKLKKSGNIENRKRKYIKLIEHYISTPTEQLRLSRHDQIGEWKNVRIYTEGETDKIIIEHAYAVLNEKKSPYWGVFPPGNLKTGGASVLNKMLSTLPPPEQHEIVIGVFDNDMKGIQEFEGLKASQFERLDNRTKKHKSHQIYAIKIPIPPNKQNLYLQEKCEFMFFEIEHYFPEELLQEHKMIKKTAIEGIYEISGDKTRFAKFITSIDDPGIFEDFTHLFEIIDMICRKKDNQIYKPHY